MVQPRLPKDISPFARSCIDALAADGLGRHLSLGGAFGLAHYHEYRPTHYVDAWWRQPIGQEERDSLAEAFEFLLTGRTARRELMASSQDEFADALRNAYVGTNEQAFVAATIKTADGISHIVKRVLVCDYGKRQDCVTTLEIDGQEADEVELERLGIRLSQPPLEAPVLAQHTLSYIFSVRPQDRAVYFKTLLEVGDLDRLRKVIAGQSELLKLPDEPLLGKLKAAAAIPTLTAILNQISENIPDQTTLSAQMTEAASALAGGDLPPDDDPVKALDEILSERRNKAFPVRLFKRSEFAGWFPPTAETWRRLDSYLYERRQVDENLLRLVSLFGEALKLPSLSTIDRPIECPLCATESALTPERAKQIRQIVEKTKAFKTAEAGAREALATLRVSAEALAAAPDAALPSYLKMKARERRSAGFTVPKIAELVGGRASEVVDAWLAQVRPLLRAATALRRGATAVVAIIKDQTARMGTLDIAKLNSCLATLGELRSGFSRAVAAYAAPAASLGSAMNGVLDSHADATGWQDFIDVAREQEKLRRALIEREARLIVGRELEAALKQIDRAREEVLEDKFSDYSDLVQRWWERLRPSEPTFFSAIQPRKGAKRTIDFKAGLSLDADRSSAKLRDVIAVFSFSQLHCLGLALFLARAEYEGLGFIVLDDPVLSSDEDYRVHFTATVLSELLKIPMQVVVLTQDHTTWREIENRYRHMSVSTAQLFVETAAGGSVIENTSDMLLEKISRARSLARGGHPDLRKECGVQLRDAGELFCKQMLVRDRYSKGDAAASLADYGGKTLEWLCPHVEPLLVCDPSHPGKLRAFQDIVNKACHDNAPPSPATMTFACGEIASFHKEYLSQA